jgi:peroxiredoxin Q/BCP
MLENLAVPDFELPATGDKTFRLSQQRGKTVVMYFYPKDNTPGCTEEGIQFRDRYAEFQKANCEIFGISRDSVRSHESFKAKMSFPFDLLSDPDERVCEMFGVMRMKNMYGKQVRGIERSTFVIDSNGVLRKEWRGVKVPEHVDAVLSLVRTL